MQAHEFVAKDTERGLIMLSIESDEIHPATFLAWAIINKRREQNIDTLTP
jgi:hypothetical protein